MTSYQYLDQDTRDQLMELMDGEPEEIIDLIETLEETNPVYFEDLKASILSSDSSGVRNAAHALKSAYAQVGAFAMSDLLRQIEALGREGNLGPVEELFSRAQAELIRVNDAFQSWKEHLSMLA